LDPVGGEGWKIVRPGRGPVWLFAEPLLNERADELACPVAVSWIFAVTGDSAEDAGGAVAELDVARAPVRSARRLCVVPVARRRGRGLEILTAIKVLADEPRSAAPIRRRDQAARRRRRERDPADRPYRQRVRDRANREGGSDQNQVDANMANHGFL